MSQPPPLVHLVKGPSPTLNEVHKIDYKDEIKQKQNNYYHYSITLCVMGTTVAIKN